MSWQDTASDNDLLLLVGGMIPIPPDDEEEQESRIEPSILIFRDWTLWDEEHPWIRKAREHMEYHAHRFYDEGGTIEEIHGDTDEGRAKLRDIDRRELVELRQELEKHRQLTDRETKGFRLAHIAATFGITEPHATIRVARTKEGHIAGISASHDRGTGMFKNHHLALMGATRIAHGAGSALTQRVMQDAARRHRSLQLVPYDDAAARYWHSVMGAHESVDYADMGWTPDEVERMLTAA
jgi:hypothetical protein